MAEATEPTYSPYGDYHCIYERGMKVGRRVNETPLQAATFLMTYVMIATDDYLIFPADGTDLLVEVCPRREDIDAESIEKMLDACEAHGLISIYEADDARWGVFLEAPPKRTKNGKHGRRFPHPPATVAEWKPQRRQWLSVSKRSGVSKRSKKSKRSTDNRTEQNRTEHISFPPKNSANEPTESRSDPAVRAGGTPDPHRGNRKPDPVWDTLQSLFYPDGVPRSQKARFGAAVRDLAKLKATPDTIRQAYETADKQWQQAFGPEALVKHWTALSANRKPVKRYGVASNA